MTVHLRLLVTLLFLLSACTCVHAQKGATLYANSRDFTTQRNKVFDVDLAPFFHGVASGDPMSDRVMLWTRVTPETLDGLPIECNWRIATDTALTEVVTQGSFTTGPERDYTVKVDVDGLAPGTTYYYGFTALGANSLTGKTKTTPTADQVDHLRFGVVSCSNFQGGYFNAYGHLAKRNDLDAIIHLGDYIYENANFTYGNDSIWNDRLLEPGGEIISLFDYRARYSTYRLDTHLIRAHQQHPIIAVWDDHETANDSWSGGASNHTPGAEGDWDDRVGAARRAYFEWLPIRDPGDSSLYRTLSYGNLADLIMLDTRIEGRDEQVDSLSDPVLDDPDRTILGGTQRQWFLDRLANSTARWKIVGQQVIFSEFNVGFAGALIGQSYEATESLFLDIWDGYPAERRRIMDFITEEDIENVVILTGDFHTSLAYEVVAPAISVRFQDIPPFGPVPFYDPIPEYDPATGRGAVAVEFATPSITSANFDENVGVDLAVSLQGFINQPIINGPLNLGNPNPHLKHVDLIRHGYYTLNVRPDSVQADYYYTDILDATAGETFGAGLTNGLDTNQLVTVPSPADPKIVQDVPAPANPPGLIDAVREPIDLRVLSVYPNPTDRELNVQYALNAAGPVGIEMTDASGRVVFPERREEQPAGLYTFRTGLDGLPAGTYFLRLTTETGTVTQSFVKR